MELIEFKIKRFKELVKGILLGSGTQWSLTRLNVVDYVLDGYQFTNNNYIASSQKISDNSLLHRILTIKNESGNIMSGMDSNILDEYQSLYSFLRNDNILIAICLHREDVLYVGKIKEVGSKSFTLESYDPQLHKSGLMKIDFTKVRYIQIHTDYLDSLSLVLDNR